MYNNPFPDEQTEAIEKLQPRSDTPPPMSQPQAAYPAHQGAGATSQPMAVDIEGGEAHHREDALTIKFAIGKLNDYLQWFLTVLEATLLIRFLLKMFGADPTNPFANFVFSLTEILLVPFNGIVPSPSMRPPNQAFEISTLIAALIYFLVFYALKRFLHILISSPEEPVE